MRPELCFTWSETRNQIYSCYPSSHIYFFQQLLEINHRKVRQLEVKHQNEIRQLQERLQQEEESVVALREEGRLKEQQMAKLKKSLKEVDRISYIVQ